MMDKTKMPDGVLKGDPEDVDLQFFSWFEGKGENVQQSVCFDVTNAEMIPCNMVFENVNSNDVYVRFRVTLEEIELYGELKHAWFEVEYLGH